VAVAAVAAAESLSVQRSCFSLAAFRSSWAQAALEAYQRPQIAAARMAVTALSAPF
jgi:hypothetical protein